MKIHNISLFNKSLRYLTFVSILSLILSTLSFPVSSVEAAETGCCVVGKVIDMIPIAAYNWDKNTCESYPVTNPGYIAKYFENQETKDNKVCVEKQKPGTENSLPKISNPLDAPNLMVSIPGFTSFGKTTCTDTECVSPWLSNYIDGLYRYGTGAIVILAVIVMMIAGVIWITAGGKEERIADAKQWIGGSLMGLLIAFSSYLILNVINPALTVLSPIKLSYVEKIDVPEIDLSKSAEENGITQTQLNTLRGENPFQEGCGNIEKCKQFGSTMPPGLVKVDAKYGNVYLKSEVYEAFKRAQDCVNPNKVMFTFTDGWRSAAAQIDVKRRKPDLAATPCCSNHGSGSAMDLAVGKKGGMSWEYNESSGLKRCMNQNNLFANLKSGKKNEPWHWSPTGK